MYMHKRMKSSGRIINKIYEKSALYFLQLLSIDLSFCFSLVHRVAKQTSTTRCNFNCYSRTNPFLSFILLVFCLNPFFHKPKTFLNGKQRKHSKLLQHICPSMYPYVSSIVNICRDHQSNDDLSDLFYLVTPLLPLSLPFLFQP